MIFKLALIELLSAALDLGMKQEREAEDSVYSGIDRQALASVLAADPMAKNAIWKLITRMKRTQAEGVNKTILPDALTEQLTSFESKIFSKNISNAKPLSQFLMTEPVLARVPPDPESAQKEKETENPIQSNDQENTGRDNGSNQNSSQKEEDGNDPTDTPPPNLYGEIVTDSGGYAISIGVVACLEETNDGPGSDEVNWVCDITQVFKNPNITVDDKLISSEYEQFDDGDKYSAVQREIVSDDSGYGKISLFADDRLCPRLWTSKIIEGKKRFVLNTQSRFKLQHFESCTVTITLTEIDNSDVIRTVIGLLTTIANIGLQATPGGAISSLSMALSNANSGNDLATQAINELRESLKLLLGQANDRIGQSTVRIRKTDIERAFGGTVNSSDESGVEFEYVHDDRKKQTGFTKDGGEYEIHIRYEKYPD